MILVLLNCIARCRDVGWVEVRNPTESMLVLGYAVTNPTYDIKVDFPDLILLAIAILQKAFLYGFSEQAPRKFLQGHRQKGSLLELQYQHQHRHNLK